MAFSYEIRHSPLSETYEVLRHGDKSELGVSTWILERKETGEVVAGVTVANFSWVHWRERVIADPERYRFYNEEAAALALSFALSKGLE